MTHEIWSARQFSYIGRELLVKFSSRFPDKKFDEFYSAAFESLRTLVRQREAFPGALGGWAGGIVYAISQHRWRLEHPIVRNAELEEVFGVSMSTIYKRAKELWSVIYSEVECVT